AAGRATPGGLRLLYEEKASASRSVDVIWHTVDTSDGTYLAAADACWDIIFTRHATGSRVLLSGPSSGPTEGPYRTGNRHGGVRFTQGTYFTHVDPHSMCDRTIPLPMLDVEHFELADRTWPMPDYATVDDLLAAFDGHG